jgi:hypothetical protein
LAKGDAMDQGLASNLKTSLPQHLSQQGFISRSVGKSIGSLDKAKVSLAKSDHPLAKWLSGVLPESHVPAELYSRYLRPSVANEMKTLGHGRVGMPLALGGVAAGMLGADYVQNKIQGN